MKTLYPTLLFFFSLSLYCSAQTADIAYHVSKDYDKEGNLIRYDSVRKTSLHCFNFDFDTHSLTINKNKLDSLRKCFSVFDDKVLVIDDNEIVMGGKANAGIFGFSIDAASSIVKPLEHHLTDSIVINRLEKAKERIEKRLKHLKKNQQKKAN